jgi:GT2 family glycosyltransferase
METVIAAVVTYNRKTLLCECISALRNQSRKPDKILVIDNGSTDDTAQWLSEQEDIITITQSNCGGAGGFRTAIEWSYRQGFTWVWCMDDDGYPAPDALYELLKHEPHERALLNCAVINKNNKQDFVWKTGNYKTIAEVDVPMIKGIAHPFNGTLIHRAIIDKAGFPNKKLFLWGDETEYYYRIVKQCEVPVYTVTSSIHYHPATAFSLKKDWDFQSSWKMYYYVRNRFYVHKSKFNNRVTALLHYLSFIAAFTGIILLFQKTQRRKKLMFLLWPIKDAFQYNFSATPSFILSQLNEQAAAKHSFSLLKTFKYIGNLLFSVFNTPAETKTAGA